MAASFANCPILDQSFAFNASPGTIHDPPTVITFGSTNERGQVHFERSEPDPFPTQYIECQRQANCRRAPPPLSSAIIPIAESLADVFAPQPRIRRPGRPAPSARLGIRSFEHRQHGIRLPREWAGLHDVGGGLRHRA